VSRFTYYYAECRYAECHYGEYRYAECRYVKCRGALIRLSLLAIKYQTKLMKIGVNNNTPTLQINSLGYSCKKCCIVCPLSLTDSSIWRVS
jgi:hypothetical protein